MRGREARPWLQQAKLKDVIEAIVLAERAILYTLSFQIKIDLPLTPLLAMLESIGSYCFAKMPEEEKRESRMPIDQQNKVAQVAVNFANDRWVHARREGGRAKGAAAGARAAPCAPLARPRGGSRRMRKAPQHQQHCRCYRQPAPARGLTRLRRRAAALSLPAASRPACPCSTLWRSSQPRACSTRRASARLTSRRTCPTARPSTRRSQSPRLSLMVRAEEGAQQRVRALALLLLLLATGSGLQGGQLACASGASA